MLTRICKKCGWVVPAVYKGGTCPICHTYFTEGACVNCRTYADKLVEGKFCRPCFSKKYNTPLNARWRAENRATSIAKYEEWLSRIKQLPSDYPTLNQEQWLDACKHFKGCAVCGAESIDTRAYFITFEEGGRYCDWNIIPACAECAVRGKLKMNPFIMLEKPLYRQAINDIVDYLEGRLNAASNARNG